MNRIFTFSVFVLLLSFAFPFRVDAQNGCNEWQQRDSTFGCAPFSPTYCTSECAGDTAPYYRNDDGATALIILPFNFCFWGINTDSVYINTNGNLTFGKYGAGYTTFSPDTFPQVETTVPPMIAPFWGDVDLVGGTGGTDAVIYKITAHYMIVQWDSVGYYDVHHAHTNSFQVIITDGTDPIVPLGNNVSFTYRRMQWTTGDASNGNGGFGGDPATVGANEGDGIRAIQIGLFDNASANYVGQYPPAPNYDGVAWLDYKYFVFNLCAGTVAPLLSGITPCDTFKVCLGDSVLIPFFFFTPIQGDSVWSNLSPPVPTGVNIVYNHPGPIDSLTIAVVGLSSNYGFHTVNVYGYDNANPHDTSYTSFVIEVDSAPTIHVSIRNDTICAGDTAFLTASGSRTYTWSTGATTASISVTPSTTQTYTLGVSDGGCVKDTIVQVIVLPTPAPTITPKPDTICPKQDVWLVASGGGTYRWSTGQTTDSIKVNPDSTKTYSLFASNGICGDSTKISVFVKTPGKTTLTHSTDTLCPGQPFTLTASGGTTYLWNNGATTSSITVNPDSTATYTVYDSVICAFDSTKQKVVIIPLPVPKITGSLWKCKGAKDTLFVSSSNGPTTYKWSNGSTKNFYITGSINADSTVKVYAYNSLGCLDSTTYAIDVRIAPTLSISPPVVACAGIPVEIIAKAVGSNSPFTYTWSTGQTSTSLGPDTIHVTPTSDTTINVLASNGCTARASTSLIPNSPSLFACCSTTILTGHDTIIVAHGDSIMSYSWSPAVICLNPMCDSVKVTPSVTTTYTVTGTDSLGCQTERIITITIEIPCLNLTIPNVITPDYPGPYGVNNEFYIKTENVNDWSLIIYNRWGIEVYESSNPLQYWDGSTLSNEKAPDGVYYYIITGTCQKVTYKMDGFVQLIR